MISTFPSVNIVFLFFFFFFFVLLAEVPIVEIDVNSECLFLRKCVILLDINLSRFARSRNYQFATFEYSGLSLSMVATSHETRYRKNFCNNDFDK